MGETHGHYSKKALVVSQTEPTNPSDGLLWYKPDLCLTTTTTRIPCYYEGVLTVGYNADPEAYGFFHGAIGSINPNDVNVGAIFWDAGVNNNIQVHLIDGFGSGTLFIDEVQYELTGVGTYMGYNVHMITNILSNPFPAEGETCNIRICMELH